MAQCKLTPEVHDAIVQAVRSGLPIVLAAAKVGVRKHTIYAWLKKGRAEDEQREPFASFATDVDRARALYAESMVGIVGDHAPKDYKAATWMLERQFREFRPAHEQKLEVEGKGKPVAQVLFVGAQEPEKAEE